LVSFCFGVYGYYRDKSCRYSLCVFVRYNLVLCLFCGNTSMIQAINLADGTSLELKFGLES
jgi:hypothetical protein